MSTEDQLRAAGRAVREQVRDLPPLDLRAQPAANARARSLRAAAVRRWPSAGWLVPAAAAAAVITVAVILVAVKSPPLAAHQSSPGPARSASAGPAATAAPEAVPKYFAAISGLEVTGKLPPAGQSGLAQAPRPDSVVVGETLTGQRVATVVPPAGNTFVGVTGAADDRTFVLDSMAIKPGLLMPTERRSWYLLKVSPGAAPAATVARISIPVPDADVNGIALSPDGTRLAVLYQVAAAGAGGRFPYFGPLTLAVYSVATGTVLRSWTGTDPDHAPYSYGSDSLPDSNVNLSWTANGQQLAFAYRGAAGPDIGQTLRKVGLAAPGGDLFRDSSVIAGIADSPATGRPAISCDSLGISGDGQSAVCGGELPWAPPVGTTLDALTRPGPWVGCAAPTDTAYPGIADIALSGDLLYRVLYEAKPACMGSGTATVLWSSPSSGKAIAAVGYTDDPSMTEHRAVVLSDHGMLTTLDWPGAVSTLAASQVAF